MKKILVPTDFSKHADNALSFAIAIANRLSSHITLYHAFKVHTTTADMLRSVEPYIREDAEADMKELVSKSQAKLSNGATLEGMAVKGDTIDSITHKADQEKYDLIVMGTQGASGLLEVFLGSTTNGVIRRTKTPVLAIPNGYEYKAFQDIVLAVDSREIGEPELLQPLIFLVKAYGAKLSIYHKVEGQKDEGIDPSLGFLLKDIEFGHNLDFSKKSVKEGITDFIDAYGGDLLCMIRRRQGFLERLFLQSVTRKEAFTTELPLLVLQDTTKA